MRAGPVSGSISLKVLGQVRAARFSCSPHEFVRSRAELAGNADEHLLLDIQLRGVNKLRQRERDLVTVRHQGHIYSSWAPFRNLVDGGGAPADLMVLMVPARSVISRLPPAAIFRGKPFSFDDALGEAFRLLLDASMKDQSPPSADAEQLIVEALTWFLADAAKMRLLPSRRSVRQIVELWMGQHLDATLSPESVARRFNLSLRTLHRCFGETGCSFERTLSALRADKLRAHLSDPVTSRRSLTDLACELGFFDAAHATRTFKSRFGMSPKEFREEVRGLSQ